MEQNIMMKQRLPFSKKKENDYQWAKNYAKGILEKYGISSEDDNYKKIINNYKFYNNEISQEDFEYECSILGIEKAEFNDVIQPFNWIYNIINVLIGENDNRPFNHRAVLVNEEGVTSYTNRYKKLQYDFTVTLLQREMEKIRLETMKNNPPQYTGDDQQDAEIQQQYEQQIQEQIAKIAEISGLLSEENIKDKMSSWQDEREILSNKLLAYYKKYLEIKPMKSDSFKHGQISNIEVCWVGIKNDEPYIKLLNPINVFYHKSPDIKYIQKGEYGGYVEYATISDVLNRYSDYLSDEEVERLESRSGFKSGNYGKDVPMMSQKLEYRKESFNSRWFGNKEYYKDDEHVGAYGEGDYGELVEVIHFEWVSQKLVWFIEYVDEFGEIQEDTLSEEFKIPEDAEKETVTNNKGKKKKTYYYFEHPIYGPVKACKGWIPEVWELTQVDNDIYLNIGPKEEQFRSYSNPFEVELGYKGLVYNNMNASSVSKVDRMKPFQYLYLIVMHKMKQMIALDKPPVLNVDVDELPDNIDKKEFIHFMDTAGIKFTQRLKHVDNPQAANLIATTRGGVEDRSTLQHIVNYYTVLNLIKQDIMLSAGVNPERMGQTSSAQTVSNMQQNITQTAHITDYEFKVHNLHWSKVLNSLITVALNYHRNNQKDIRKRFILDDGTYANLMINIGDFDNCDIGIFTTDSGKEHEIFDHMKNMTQALIQNDKINFSLLKNMLASESLEELDGFIEEYEANQERREQQMQQMQQEHEQRMQEREIEAREDQQAHEIELKSMDIEAKIYDSQLDALKFNKEASPEDIHKFVNQERDREMKAQLEASKLQKEIASETYDRQLKREEIASKERIAKDNNKTKIEVENKKLKNPVSGEKITKK